MSDIVFPEIVVGIVGRIGVDTTEVAEWIEASLHKLFYQSHTIKLTDYLSELNLRAMGVELVDSPLDRRYETRIGACNKIRELSNRKDFFASVAIGGIKGSRDQFSAKKGEATRISYIIDQIKRPEEAKALRKVYGEQFILISCHAPMEDRITALSRKIAGQNPGQPKPDQWRTKAKELIEIDNSQGSVDFGQRVGKVFHLADLIINCSNQNSSVDLLDRIFNAFFGNPSISPTRAEFFQNIAMNVALTSCDTARQVGAAIETGGEIAATGFNEAPKAGGGTYWSDEGIDARDVTLGLDLNTVRKRQMAAEIVQILRDREELKNNDISDKEISELYLDSDEAPLKDSQIMDTLEFGRAVHAEMAALSAAARLGVATKGSTLYCTTFPCHNCSKHIVASGIVKVVYLEPYPKSFADYLYPDSISIDPRKDNEDYVTFEQFTGITPFRYRNLFAKGSSKDAQGYVLKWSPKDSQPVLKDQIQEHFDNEIAFQSEVKRTVANFSHKNAVTLGLVSQ